MQRHVKSQSLLRRRRQAEEQKKAATSKTTYVLLILVFAIIIVISIQLYFLSHGSLPSSFQSVSLEEVFPDFATSFSLSASTTSSSWTEKGEGNPELSDPRNITQGETIFLPPTNQQQRSGDGRTKDADKIREEGGMDPILKILKQAGHDLNDKELFTPEILAALPKWDDLTNFYGPPVILGLETCEAFRQAVPANERLMSIAGTFNSGTNLLYGVLRANCWNPSIRRGAKAGSGVGLRWQVPWGKHYPAEYRGIHFAERADSGVKPVLPIVTIRDPYTWMQSMCRQPYAAYFVHGDDTCPNIVPYPSDRKAHPRFKKSQYIPVNIKYGELKVKHESLGHFWNEWNGVHLYQNVTVDDAPEREKYPRIMVRMEDIVFRAEEVVPQLCDCAGFQHTTELVHHAAVANNNPGVKHSGSGSGLLRSIIKYGNVKNRRKGYPDFQLKAAREVLSSEMMKLFQYRYEPLQNETLV